MRSIMDIEPAKRYVLGDPFCSATQAAHEIEAGEVTAEELLAMQIARIIDYNPALNAIVTLDLERARERARQADNARARGQSWGLLHGVPITIKDSFETAGLRTRETKDVWAYFVLTYAMVLLTWGVMALLQLPGAPAASGAGSSAGSGFALLLLGGV
jgi:hypothetical protein